MKEALFVVTVVAEILLGASLLLTLIIPSFRVWPPPGRSSWQYRYTWALTIISLVGILVLGILDWDTFLLSNPVRFVVGSVLILSGAAFALWGVSALSWHSSLGLGGRLTSTGPYRYSRNPQYVGDIALLAGYAVLCNSLLTTIAVALGIVWFILAPFAEEPWLRGRFGPAYERYASSVPRFLWRN